MFGRRTRSDYPQRTDEALMLGVAGGDTLAFDELYRRYKPALYRYFLRMLGRDRERALDFLQELFIKVVEQAKRYDSSRRFSTWLYTLAYNQCKNAYRGDAVRRTAAEYFKQTADLAQDDGPAFGQEHDHSAFLDALTDALDTLDEHHRTVFLLRYQHELSLQEIADITEAPTGTVKSRLFYAQRKLAGLLRDYDPKHLPDAL